MPRSKRKKKQKIGPFDKDEVESVQEKPKQKKKHQILMPHEKYYHDTKPKEEFFQDHIDTKYEKRRKSKMERFYDEETKEKYFQDKYEDDDE